MAALVKLPYLLQGGKEKVPSKLEETQAQKTQGGSSLWGFRALSPPFADQINFKVPV